MRRPHRGIETFDISLMAVVTKAMGAFLVMMLLLMPYYTSAPVEEKIATDLSAKVEQADQKIKDVIEKINDNTSKAEDLRELLNQVLALLSEARQLIGQLKRANDQLQAQVKRLEERVADLLAEIAALQRQVATLQGQVATLQGQIAALQAQMATLQAEIAALRGQVAQLQNENTALRERIAPLEAENAHLREELNKYGKTTLTAFLSNSECPDRIAIMLVYSTARVTLPDKSSSPYVLNLSAPSRDGFSTFNSSFIVLGGLSKEAMYLIARVEQRESKTEKFANGLSGTRLKPLLRDCPIYAGASIASDRGKIGYPLRPFNLRRGDYAVFLAELVMQDSDFEWKTPSAENLAWMADQLDHAEKEPPLPPVDTPGAGSRPDPTLNRDRFPRSGRSEP